MAGAEDLAAPAWATTVLRLGLVPVLGIAVWWVLSRLVFVVPPPLQAVGALIGLLGNAHYRGDVAQTLVKILIAFSASSVLGLAIGTLLGLVKPLRDALQPMLLIFNGVPKIVFYPILLILFGLGGTSQIVMGAIFGTLPILVTLMSALAAMPPVYRKVARMLEVPPLRAFLQVYMPAVAPSLMVALQLGFSLSALGVIYAELIASRGGLGQSVIEIYSVGNYPMLAGNVMVILAISLCGIGILRWAERIVLRHHS